MPKQKVSPIAEARRAASKAAKLAVSEHKATVKPPLKAIDPDKSYNRDSLKEVGLGHAWFREACKAGLPAQPAGKTKFVKGADLIAFIHSGKGAALMSQAKKNAANN